jgi:hypothetical protein
MRITRRQLKQLIKEELRLLEVDTDNDGKLSPDELRRMADDIDEAPRDRVRNRVHQYLIDKKFFKGRNLNGRPQIEIFWGPPEGPGVPKGAGYTNPAKDFLKLAVESGDIDWATWEEIEPVWQEIDRSID